MINEFLKEIAKKKGVTTLFSTSETAVSGKTFVTRNVESQTFISDYKPIYEDKDKEEKVIGFKPSLDDERDIGLILEATAQIEPDGLNVSLDVRAQFLKVLGNSEYLKSPEVKKALIRGLTQETRISTQYGKSILTMCTYENSISASAETILKKKQDPQKCLLLFVSVDGHSKVNLPVGNYCNVHYTSLKVEVDQKTADKIINSRKDFLNDEQVKLLRSELSKNNASIVSINNGITQNGCTTVTRNIVETYLPEFYTGYNLKGSGAIGYCC